MTARETYDLTRDHWSFLRDAYLGGRYWRTPSATTLGAHALRWDTGAIDDSGRPVSRSQSVCSYLVPYDGESDSAFAKRAALAKYANIVSPVVKAYAEGITNGITRDLAPLDGFVEDVDRSGSAWGELAEQVATWSATYGLVATVVDAPSVDVSAMSEAQRRERRIAPYVVTVHPSAWVLIECDEGRIVTFAYVSTPYRSDLSSGSTADVEVRVWRARTAEQPGSWEVRRGTVRTSVSIGEQVDGLELVSSGSLPSALAGEIPVTFCFYERDPSSECPMGVSLVSDTADAARSIYNRGSWIDEIDRNAAFPFLAIPLASTGGALDDSTQRKVGTTKAMGFASAAGSPSWVEPSGNSQRVMREQILFDFMWAMRCAGLELAADQSSQVQSGEALRIRSRDFESRARRFARNLQRWEVATLRLLATMAGRPEAGDAVVVTYPKRITMADPSEDLARAASLLGLGVEIGTTARLEAVKQAVDAALSLSDETMSVVSDEVSAIYGEDLATSSARLNVERLRAENEATGLQQIAANASAPATIAPTPAPTSEPVVEVAKSALNGAQTESVLSILERTNPGQPLPIESAVAVMGEAFPGFDTSKIEAMFAPIRRAIQQRPAQSAEQPATDAMPSPEPSPVSVSDGSAS